MLWVPSVMYFEDGGGFLDLEARLFWGCDFHVVGAS